MYIGALALPADADMQAQLCLARGGIPQFYYPWLRADGTPDTSRAQYMGCDYPPQPVTAPQPSANINVSVPTMVSPQISPQLIQQEHPSNSPVTAGATQDQSQNAPAWLMDLMTALESKTPQAPIAPDIPQVVYAPMTADQGATPAQASVVGNIGLGGAAIAGIALFALYLLSNR